MWGGDAFRAAWHGATDAAKSAVAAVATGVEKLGAAAIHGVEVAKDKIVDAAQWVAKETVATARWLLAKGQQALELGKKAAQAVGKAFVAIGKTFVAGVKSAVAAMICEAAAIGSRLIAPKVRRAKRPTSCDQATKQLAKHQKAKDMADLAHDVYRAGDPANESEPPKGFNLEGREGQVPEGLEGAVFSDPTSGFKAALYRGADGNYVLAFAGTEDGTDWKQNLAQGAGMKSVQYDQAVTLTKQVKDWAAGQGATVECAGHSLGGGLAATGAMASGLPATTFNMARPSASTMASNGIDPEEAGELVDHYYVEGEVLTGGQEHVEMLMGGAGYALGGPVGGLALGGYAHHSIGNSVGNQESLPAVDGKLDRVSLKEANAVDLHGMSYVKNGLQKQITEDQKAKEVLCE